MRLSKIKLAGFKSFVDPTTIPMPSNLIGIVGPNGCGKSNVIDAVRWVMGESSAKHLRGESMADVIFNGSNTRKSIGQASVELLFDNSDGSLGGQYAQYSEIAVKRVVSRDGVSQYYQNGTRCRRRDITDIFLGTGLGPRSYSIIEQGMISRLIEAKPEELRIFIEEAAGISKYKERRKETETRIRHTRENLDRLTDLRDELGNQLERLQRQSKQAEKYKIFKQEERLLKAQLTALKWRVLDGQITEKQNGIQEVETQFEAIVAKLRNVEADIERQREEHLNASEEFNEIQGRFYSVGADIARVEQSIQHTKDRRQQHEIDLKQAESSWFEAQAHVKNDASRMEQLSASLTENQPQLEQCRQAKSASAEKLTSDEERMHEWQSRWDEFNQNAALPAQQAEVEKARLEHLEKQMLSVLKQRDQIQQESKGLTAEDLRTEIEEEQLNQERLKTLYTDVEEKLQEKMIDISQMRESNKTLDKELDEARSEIQELKGRHASLAALQQAALGRQQSAVNQWLENHGYGTAKRLAEQISVESGWESAVECVLGNYLQAVCLDELDPVMGVLSSLEHGSVTILDTANDGSEGESPGEDRLLAKVDAPWSIAPLLGRVICVDNLEQAISLRASLSTNQSVVTRDGIWLGHGWLRVTRDSDQDAGVLRRDQEMNDLNQTIGQLVSQIDVTETRLVKGRQQLEEHEEQRDKLQDELQIAIRNHAQAQASVESKQSQLDKSVTRLEQAQQQLLEIEKQISENEQDTNVARQSLGEAVAQMETLADQRDALSKERILLKDALAESRTIAANDREAAHEISLKVETLKTELRSTEENRERMQGQMTQLSQRKDELQRQITDSEEPLETLKKELDAFLRKRVEVETELKEARLSVETLDHSMRELTSDRQRIEQEREEIRASLEQIRMAQKELIVRRETLEESLQEGEHQLEQIFSELPDTANEEEWKALVEKNDRRIQRLGAINLAAIDEYKQQAERKEYLDAQHEDLIEALTTLENAIRKIDKETRARFKDTYDKINDGFQKMFPVLFGGGHSYLELTGEDLLDTGVAVMARPPGKRNSSIHQLSGGEKALTAVALVFSIFQLNPAPFCMLDEVDAPLDDANVARYCKLVAEMSATVQFIVITHNKLTMEMVHQLNGVTMQEPGVSRIVAVDVDAAAEMAVS